MRKVALVVLLAVLGCMAVACCSPGEEPPVAPESPAQAASEGEETSTQTPPEAEDASNPEEELPDGDTAQPETGPEPSRLYHDFFADEFEIIAYDAVPGGSWQLWGHSVQGEVRLTKQVYLNTIQGFDAPVLVLAEFTLGEDGVTLTGEALLHAYLIKDGALTSDLNRAEFDAIFTAAPESEGGGWATRHQGELVESVKVNGAPLFFLDFAGDVRSDGSMDTVLDWLRQD